MRAFLFIASFILTAGINFLTIYTFKYIHDIFLLIIMPFMLLVAVSYFLIIRYKDNPYTSPIAYGIIYCSALILVLGITLLGTAVYLYSR